MYARFIHFDGPRSAELVAAAERAGRERLAPAIEGDEQLRGELVALLVCRREDGGEIVVTVTTTQAGLDRVAEVAMSTELLPDEDPALLTEPDRVEILEVVESRIWSTVPA